jgi:uncharacterized protein YndB with AHSA1/START domain
MTTTLQAEKELTITRVFNAPRALVFKAWTDPIQLAKWWGPNGYTSPVCRLDLRPGGSIYIDMKAPDGTVYPMHGVFKEITEPDKLVFTTSLPDENGNPLFETLNTITLAEENKKTKFTLHVIASKITPGGEQHIAGMKEGWNQTIDRLEVQLATFTNEPLVFERVFPAPAAMIWKALTDKTEMKKWYFDVPDFKPVPGQEFQFLAGEKGKEYLHLCKVTEVIPGKKIAYTWRYDGYEGNSEVSFELFPEGNQTRLKLVHTGLETFPVSNPGFAKGNFVIGWTYFLDKALPGYIHQ